MDVSKSHDPWAPEGTDLYSDRELAAHEDPEVIQAIADALARGVGAADVAPRSLEQLTALSKPELQELASEHDLPVSGTKEEIAARILEARNQSTEEE